MNRLLKQLFASDLLLGQLFYLLIVGCLLLVVFLIGSLLLGICSIKKPGLFRTYIGRVALFLVLFLNVGAGFNTLWSCLVWDHLYFTPDYTFGFTPLWPITQATINAPWGDTHGYLIGVSLFELQVVWLAYAIASWSTTICLFLIIHKFLGPRKPRQSTEKL